MVVMYVIENVSNLQKLCKYANILKICEINDVQKHMKWPGPLCSPLVKKLSNILSR
jgi:hypothetical protein